MYYPEELTNTYNIYEQIGAGGGGTVFRATHKRLQKTVVLKKLIGSGTNMKECRTEVDILKNLRHSYLPQVLDFIECEDGIYTVMDFIPGRSLRQMMDDGHKFTEKAVLKYARQLCEALDYLHSQNPSIIHGDIKPDNIMITPEDNVCLIDFNISGVLEGKGAQTQGYTPGFSAPEQVEAFEKLRLQMQLGFSVGKQHIGDDNPTVKMNMGDDTPTVKLNIGDDSPTVLLNLAGGNDPAGDNSTTLLLNVNPIINGNNNPLSQPKESVQHAIIIDKRSDIFSLGATIYTLLTGKLFNVTTSSTANIGISNGFQAVLSKALAKSPDHRYQDAGQMLKAVLQVHKKDKRYKRLLLRQELIMAFMIVILAVSAFMMFEGRKRIELEREEYYYTLIAQMQEGADNNMSAEAFDAVYDQAIGMYPDYFEAYYVKAYYLFNAGDYEGAIGYMENIPEVMAYANGDMLGNWYQIYAECYFRLENYEMASVQYQNSLKYRSDNPTVYRDYAISLVYLNKVQQAEQTLQKAIEEGMDQVDVYMVQGEIERMAGNDQIALEYFEKVLEMAADEYLLQRAYIMTSKTYTDMETAEALLQDVNNLTAGIVRLSMSNRLLLYERLAQDYIALGELEEKHDYYASAVEVFSEMKAMHWDTYLTYNNAIILCQRMTDLESAEKWAQDMLQKYPENYMTYIRLAYLELEKQNQKANEGRDYKGFEEYYLKAKGLFEENTSGNVTNAEIQLLEEIYRQVSDGGWLE